MSTTMPLLIPIFFLYIRFSLSSKTFERSVVQYYALKTLKRATASSPILEKNIRGIRKTAMYLCRVVRNEFFWRGSGGKDMITEDANSNCKRIRKFLIRNTEFLENFLPNYIKNFETCPIRGRVPKLFK